MLDSIDTPHPAAEMITRVAHKGFSVDSQPNILLAVTRVINFLVLVDRAVDPLGEASYNQTTAGIVDSIRNGSVFKGNHHSPDLDSAVTIFNSHLDEKPACVRKKVADHMDEIFGCNGKIRLATTSKVYLAEKKKEAYAFADTILSFAHELGENERFAKFFRVAHAAETFADCFLDVAHDFRKKEIKVKPIQVRFGLAANAACCAVRLLHAHPRKGRINLVGTMLHWAWSHLKFDVAGPFANHFEDQKPSRRASLSAPDNGSFEQARP